MNLQVPGVYAAAALSAAMMWKNMFDWRKGAASAGGDSDSDILAETENAAYEKAAEDIRARKQKSSPGERLPDTVVWQDQPDVYRPASMDLASAAGQLGAMLPLSGVRRKSVVCITATAVQEFRTHLASDTSVELGGLLTGQAFFDVEADAYLVYVDQYLAAQGGKETPISFEYTAETWDALYPTLQSLPTGHTIVGSCHSHPGLGVFLSTTDIDTQASVFSQDWQIAIVHDPIQDDTGYFISPHGTRVNQIIVLGGTES
jgi:proteasome lid subunit RPN8/RPN11